MLDILFVMVVLSGAGVLGDDSYSIVRPNFTYTH